MLWGVEKWQRRRRETATTVVTWALLFAPPVPWLLLTPAPRMSLVMGGGRGGHVKAEARAHRQRVDGGPRGLKQPRARLMRQRASKPRFER